MREGPEKITIPSQNHLSCHGCKYHEHRLVRSGRHPKYAEDCKHPSTNDIRIPFYGNLPGDAHTPDWCPFLRKKEDDLKKRSETIELLEKYSKFLEKQGYLDIDWNTEEPYAIDEFLKTLTP